MANWCYGTILVSGRKTDVENFIESGAVNKVGKIMIDDIIER